MHIKQKFGIALTGMILITTACSKSPSPAASSSLFGSYDQTGMLNNIGNNVLMAGINSTATSATATQTAVSAFVSAPSATTLTAAQTAFATLAQAWAATAPFDFGPIQDNLIEATVDTWPASDSKIEAAIVAGSTAASVGADTKGLKGLEYLLFDPNGNTAVLAKYTGSGATSRGTFANSVAADLVTQTTSLQNYWKNGYLASFESAKGNDVSSSVGQLINAISLYLDQVKNMKIGSPIGMGVKVNDNLPHPTLIEYTIAEQSLPVMEANLQAMKAAFDGGTGQGLDDLLNYVNAKSNGQNLSTVVDAQFNDAISKIAAITPPYATAVSTQTVQLQAVFASLKTLIAYFKVDVANNLGVTITFTDTDGD